MINRIIVNKNPIVIFGLFVSTLLLVLLSFGPIKTLYNNGKEPPLNEKEFHPRVGGGEAQAFFERMIRNPKTGEIPYENLSIISDQMQKNVFSSENRAANIWTERGPANIQGRLKSIMVDKRDASGNTVIVGSDTGGLWKSTNALDSNPIWVKLDDFLEFLHTQSIVQNPANLDEMYCSTGNISWVSDETAGVGLYKSINGGDTWSHLASTNNGNFRHAGNIVIGATGILFVSTHEGGIQRSTDGGQTWTKVLGNGVGGGTTDQMFDLDKATNGRLYATSKDKKIYRSDDNGASWINITGSVSQGDGLIRLAVAPSNPDRVYAFVEWAKNYRTDNGGASWEQIASMDANIYGQSPDGVISMEVDPGNPDRVFAGGVSYHMTSNAGGSWHRFTGWEVHVDGHAIAFDNSNTVYLGTDGGIYRTFNGASDSPSFQFIGNGLNTIQYYNIDLHPQAGNDYFIGGTQDNGTLRMTGTTITTAREALGGDGGFAHIDRNEPHIQWASTQWTRGAFTTNSWASSTGVDYVPSDAGYFITPTDYDDVNNRLYACMSSANKYSVVTGVGGSFSVSEKTINALNGGKTTSVMVSPNNPDNVYFGADNGLIVKVTNPTAPNPSGTTIMNGPAGWISSIAVEPGDENHIIATYSSFGVNHIVETFNGGANWTDISNNFPDMPVYNGIFAPDSSDKFILATHLGVWMTENLDGPFTNWVAFNDGLANVIVRMVKARVSDGLVVAGTHGRGMFTTSYFSVDPQDTEAPTAPGTPVAGNVSSYSCTLDWTASTDDLGVIGYDVYQGTTLITSVASNFAAITGLSPETTYSFTVKAKDAAGNVSTASEAVAVTTLPGSGATNIALTATATTSYVSSWETLAAVNDNSYPTSSNDKSSGAYGNWDNPNSIQWVQYDWPADYDIESTELYWFDDGNGVWTPTTAYIEYWNGSAWINAGSLPTEINAWNTLPLNVTTSRIRVSMLNTSQSTGILEWRVVGKVAGSGPIE